MFHRATNDGFDFASATVRENLQEKGVERTAIDAVRTFQRGFGRQTIGFVPVVRRLVREKHVLGKANQKMRVVLRVRIERRRLRLIEIFGHLTGAAFDRWPIVLKLQLIHVRLEPIAKRRRRRSNFDRRTRRFSFYLIRRNFCRRGDRTSSD